MTIGSNPDVTGLGAIPEINAVIYTSLLPFKCPAAKATAPIEKFSNYIFKEGATHGKDAVFKGLGYSAEDSAQMAKLWEEQAAAKYAQGQYTLGKLDQYGQRINITIDVPGVGTAARKTSSVTSGWIIGPMEASH